LRATDTGKAVLESIPEVGAGWHHGRDSSEQQSDEIVELRSQVESLRLENKKLDGQLQAIRKAHEERVTPFRNVFDEMRKLREVNEMLRKEKQESEASVQTMVDDLKAQMMTGLSAAVAKTQALQKQLDEVRGERDELGRRLASCQSEQQ
jgi:chromosome segregation ATPase